MNIAKGLAGLLGLALALTPKFVPPCTRQIETAAGYSVPMHCHWTFQIEFLLAISIVIVSVALWFVHHHEALRVLGGVLVLFSGLVYAVTQPWGIGLCGSSKMHCNQSAHWLWIWAGLLALDGAFIAVRSREPNQIKVSEDPWESKIKEDK